MSFRRRAAAGSTLPAGVAAAACGSRVVSSGIRGLDALLGGGVALGRLTVLVEDAPTSFHTSVVAAFCAQGVAHGHALALASATAPAAQILRTLPGRAAASAPVAAPSAPALDIAWRYAAPARPAGDAGISAKFRVELDASTPGPPRKDARVSALGFPDTRVSHLVAAVRAHCKRARQDGVVARVAVSGLAPCLWEWEAETPDLHSALARLREAARGADVAILVTVPGTVPTEELGLSADSVVRLSTFARDGGRWAGTAVLDKAARVGPGRWLGVRGAVFVFRRARRGLVFEEAAIEPADEEEVHGDGAGNVEKVPGLACGAGPGSAGLEF